MDMPRLSIKSKHDLDTAEEICLLPASALQECAYDVLFYCMDPNWPTAHILGPVAVAHPDVMLPSMIELIDWLLPSLERRNMGGYDEIRVLIYSIILHWPREYVVPLTPQLRAVLNATNIPEGDREVLGAASLLITKFQLDVPDDVQAYARSIVEGHPHWLP
jgi:hypothetical protein